jgi:hypothetical protein
MSRKKLLAAFNAKFGPVRATADGRRRRSVGRAGRAAGGRAHPRADGVAPVQAGVTITEDQLRGTRPKCDPEPTHTDAIDSIITREFKKGASPEDVQPCLLPCPG